MADDVDSDGMKGIRLPTRRFGRVVQTQRLPSQRADGCSECWDGDEERELECTKGCHGCEDSRIGGTFDCSETGWYDCTVVGM